MTSGPGRSSGGANNNGAAAGLYKRLVKAVLGRDKAASARQPWAQETLERLVRVLQRQAQHLKVGCTTVSAILRALSLAFRANLRSRGYSLHRKGANMQLVCDGVNSGKYRPLAYTTLDTINAPTFLSELHILHSDLFSNACTRGTSELHRGAKYVYSTSHPLREPPHTPTVL